MSMRKNLHRKLRLDQVHCIKKPPPVDFDEKYYLITTKLITTKLTQVAYFVVVRTMIKGGHHSSVVSSAPTILRPRVCIPSTPSTLFSICIIQNCIEKITKMNKKRPGLAHFFKRSMIKIYVWKNTHNSDCFVLSRPQVGLCFFKKCNVINFLTSLLT